MLSFKKLAVTCLSAHKEKLAPFFPYIEGNAPLLKIIALKFFELERSHILQ